MSNEKNSRDGSRSSRSGSVRNYTEGTIYESGFKLDGQKARSTVEMNDKKFRPELGGDEIDMSAYDEILVGFPIWWYVAPTIINTFLEKYDFSGKKIILFATSGGSGFGNTVSELQPSAPDAQIVEGKLLNRMSKQEISEWVKTL